MIECLVGLKGCLIVIIVFAAEIGWLAMASCSRILSCNRTQENLVNRLEAYACLKQERRSGAPCNRAYYASEYALLPGGHEVLLGTLKKIESKSAVLSAILVFAIGAFLTYGFAGGDDDENIRKSFASGVTFLLLFPLWFSFVGIRHLDSRSISDIGSEPRKKLALRLQTDLMKDLLLKEYGFRFSLNASGVVIIFAIFVIVLDAVTNLHL